MKRRSEVPKSFYFLIESACTLLRGTFAENILHRFFFLKCSNLPPFRRIIHLNLPSEAWRKVRENLKKKKRNYKQTFLANSRVSSLPVSDFFFVLSASLVTSSKIKSFSKSFSSFSASLSSNSSIFLASTSGSGSAPPRSRTRVSSDGSSRRFSRMASLSRQETSWNRTRECQHSYRFWNLFLEMPVTFWAGKQTSNSKTVE